MVNRKGANRKGRAATINFSSFDRFNRLHLAMEMNLDALLLQDC